MEKEEKIVPIWKDRPIVRGAPDPTLVAEVEELLARAKAGEITSVIYVAVSPNGQIETRWTDHTRADDYARDIGLLESVKIDLLSKMEDV